MTVRLNLGCGEDIREAWVNVDHVKRPGVDLVLNLDTDNLPFREDEVSEVHASHVIEHLYRPLHLMGELWRVCVPGALATFRTPYGSSDVADEDPTHVRRMYAGSWMYFSQPAYWRADYGYVGDWQATRIELHLYDAAASLPDEEIPVAVRFGRNAVREMVATLAAVKPPRAARRELQEQPDLIYMRPAEERWHAVGQSTSRTRVAS